MREEPLDRDDEDERPKRRNRPAEGRGIPIWVLVVCAALPAASCGIVGVYWLSQLNNAKRGPATVRSVPEAVPTFPAAPLPVSVQPTPEPEKPHDVQDYQSYVEGLRKTVKDSPEGLVRQGLLAESYTMDDAKYSTGYFKMLVVKVDPIWLKDSVTGKTAKYTRVRLTNPKHLYGVWGNAEMLP
jgi:hypothetical protein